MQIICKFATYHVFALLLTQSFIVFCVSNNITQVTLKLVAFANF